MPDNNSVPRIPDFNMLRRIGGGSYGVVWIARSLTGIYRAVKVVDRARFNDARPFLRELDGITRFQQTVGNEPRQLALMHVGRDDEQGIFYYVMELADDVDASTDINPELYVPLTLKALRERRHRLPAAECVRLGIELARALAGLHAAGLIHRDVKPSNIIFVNGVPKLADVGLVSSSDHTLTSLGTPGYAPPEGAGTMEADVYGLGKILYELATGCPTMDFPRLPAEVTTREDTPLLLELNEVLLRACHPDPRERYPSAQAMLDDLLLLQAGKSVKELVRTKHRLRVLARASGIAALVALVALGVLGWMNYRAARQLAAQEAAARQQAEQDERLARYSADLHLAQLALNGGDFGVARSALRRQIPAAGAPDLRGIEWRALWNETAGDAARVYGEVGSQALRALAVSKDGSLVVTQAGDASRDTIVWDVQAGTRRVLASATLGLGGFSTEPFRIFVGTPDRRILTLDVLTGQIVEERRDVGRLLQGVGDGHTLLVANLRENGVELSIWDAATGQTVASWNPHLEGRPTRASAVSVSRDAKLLAAHWFWADGVRLRYELQVWDIQSQRLVYQTRELERAQCLAFSSNDQFLAVGFADQPTLVIDLKTGIRRIDLSGHVGAVEAMQFDANATRLITTGSDQTIRFWNMQSGTLERVLRGHESAVSALVLNDAANELFSAAHDGTWRSWNIHSGGSGRVVRGLWRNVLGDFLFRPDGKKVFVTDGNGRLASYDPGTLRPDELIEKVFQPLAFLSDETLLALSAERAVVKLSLPSGAIETTPAVLDSAERLNVVTASKRGHVVGFGLTDGRVVFWDISADAPAIDDSRHGTTVLALAISNDGALASSGDRDGGLHVWDVRNRQHVLALPRQSAGVRSLAFSSDRRYLAIGRGDGSVGLWDMLQAVPKLELHGHSFDVNALTFTQDGTRLIAGAYDGLITVWEVESGRQLSALTIEPSVSGGVYRIRMADDAMRFAAMTEDGRLRLWSLAAP